MTRNVTKICTIVAVAAIVAAGCGSSSPGLTSAGGHNYTVGVLTDVTGVSSSSNKTTVQGVEAGVKLASRDGYTLHYVVGDTTSSPSGALAAAKQLVQQNHVSAVIAVSTFTFAAASYLTSQGVPVIGVAEDGPEWITSTNMFSTYGATNTAKVGTTLGKFFKLAGTTVLGTVGYGISPAASEAAKAAAASAQAAGLRVGYLNSSFPLGGTNAQPVALAMKQNGVNGFTGSLEPNTSFAIISALRQVGVNLKAAVLPTGYGGDILQAGPGAIQAGQGVYFYTSFQPVEMHTAATKQFQGDLKTIGITTDPTYGEYAGYTSVAMLMDGLKAAGSNTSQSSLIQALNGLKQFNAAGLLGSHTLAPGDRTSAPLGPGGCIYFAKLAGTGFKLVPGADPLCGSIIPGITESPS